LAFSGAVVQTLDVTVHLGGGNQPAPAQPAREQLAGGNDRGDLLRVDVAESDGDGVDVLEVEDVLFDDEPLSRPFTRAASCPRPTTALC
jgi:hypothetical protein